VIVAVIAVWMMQVAVDQIIDVVAVRDRLVAASWAMNMAGLVPRARVSRRAPVGILGRHLYDMFIDVTCMHVMQVTIVQIVHMITVLHGRMAASGTMLVVVVGVVGQFAVCHQKSPLQRVHHT
jgi:hypothetical protein